MNAGNEGGKGIKRNAQFMVKLKNFSTRFGAITGALVVLYILSYAVISTIVDGTTQVKYTKESVIEDAMITLFQIRDKNAMYGQLPVTMYPISEGVQGEQSYSRKLPRMVLLSVPSELEGSKYIDMAMSCGKPQMKKKFTDSGVKWGVADYNKAEVMLTQQPIIENKQEEFSNVVIKKIDIGGNVLHAFNTVVAKDSSCRVTFADREAAIEKFYILTNSDRALLIVAFCGIGFVCFVFGFVYLSARRDLQLGETH